VDRRRRAALILVALLAACGAEDDAGPAEGGLTAEQLLDPAACKDCHPDHYREWSGSMHAYAGEDPVFRAMNRRGQRETGGALGDFCIQCHAPMAVRMGLTTDGQNLDEVPAHLRGVTCAFCHQVEAVEGAHNNPLRLATDMVLRGGIRDPVPNSAHRAAYSPLHDRDDLRSASLCGSCHDIVTPAGVHLERTYAEWQASQYASDDPQFRNTCGACHMPGRNGLAADAPGVKVRRVHDHSMPGVDLALTPFPEAEAQRERVQADLDTLLTTEICVLTAPTGAQVEVFLENVAAGHGAPSGATQDRRLWVEMVAYAGDAVLHQSGVVGDGESVSALGDPDLWLLRDRMLDANGHEVHMFWEAARVESAQLPAPSAAAPGEPGYVNVHVPKRYIVEGGPPDRVTVRARMRPMDFDVIDDLIASGDLDPAVRDRIPTFTLAGSVLEWTPEAAERRVSPLSRREALCVPRLAR
jgi:hypothetical protein